MVDIAIRVAVGVATAIACMWVANKLVTIWTERSIPDHLANWWNSLYAEIETWLAAHKHLGATRVVAKITRILDRHVIAANKLLRLTLQAQPQSGPAVVIAHRRMSAQEIAQAFPEFEQRQELTLAQTQ